MSVQPFPRAKLKVGQIDDALTHTPQTVILSRSYTNPVVLAQPPSFDGATTSVVRITDVQPDRFSLCIHKAPDKDGPHTSETVSYVVLEAGTWEVAGGAQLEVGTLVTTATVGYRISNVWAPVTFSETFSSAPVVLSQVQSNNDPHWVKTRQRNVGAGGFDVALEEEEASATHHGSKTVGWLVLDAGQGDWNGHLSPTPQRCTALRPCRWSRAGPRAVAVRTPGAVTHGRSPGRNKRYPTGPPDGSDRHSDAPALLPGYQRSSQVTLSHQLPTLFMPG